MKPQIVPQIPLTHSTHALHSMIHVLDVLLFIVQTGLLSLVSYLVFLTIAAIGASRKTRLTPAPPSTRFLILVPAHNEQTLLPTLLTNLNKLDYPSNLYAVHVVADNCEDDTALIARKYGAVVHQRFNPEAKGKGLALQWLINNILEQNIPHDAVVFLDADSEVSSNFLRVMDSRLVNGERVIQAYYSVKEAERSPAVALRWAALAVIHYLRPLGRMRVGGSAGLKGNGMVFKAEVMREHEWSSSVTEDIELHMKLLLAGERVNFAPDAVVWAEMPETLARSRTQNVRWEQGRLSMIKQYVPALLIAGIRKSTPGRSFPLFDAVMEHLIPPFSILAALSFANFAAIILRTTTIGIFNHKSPKPRPANGLNKFSLGLAVLTIAGQIFYFFVGIRLANAPRAVYRALFMAPLYIIWKTWHYIQILLNIEPQNWVRTARNEE